MSATGSSWHTSIASHRHRRPRRTQLSCLCAAWDERPTIAASPSHGLRAVTVPRRHYGASTPFSDNTLAPLKPNGVPYMESYIRAHTKSRPSLGRLYKLEVSRSRRVTFTVADAQVLGIGTPCPGIWLRGSSYTAPFPRTSVSGSKATWLNQNHLDITQSYGRQHIRSSSLRIGSMPFTSAGGEYYITYQKTMSTFHSIEVGDDVHLAYIDSGPPPSSSSYTTLLFVHGFGWNARIFEKVIDAAQSHGLRIMAIHRRNYEGSTPFSEDELAPLKADDVLQTGAVEPFMDKRAVEIATLIQKIAQAGDIPKPAGDVGGIVLVGWSIGNTFGIDFLGRISRLPAQLQDTLRTYLCGYIVYDPPLDALDVPAPHPSGISFVRFTIQRALAAGTSPEEAVNKWLSSWGEYSHPDSTDVSERYDHFNDGPRARASLRELEADNPALRACISFDRAATDHVMTPALYPGSYKRALAKTLYEDPEEAFWPGMKVEYLYCANSLWNVMYGADAVRDRFESAVPRRRMNVMKEANHFAHWENPERLIKVLKAIV